MRRIFMKFFYFIAVAVMIAALLIILAVIPSSNAQNDTTQEYHPSRFAVIAAEVNVLTPDMGGRNATQHMMLRVDTVTGRTWLLQVNVAGGNEPHLRTAVWRETGTKQ
jgi:hypothetical protein